MALVTATLVQAEWLIRWCQADPFWRRNVLSMPTFRAKYDQLRLKAEGAERAGSSGHVLDRHAAQMAGRP